MIDPSALPLPLLLDGTTKTFNLPFFFFNNSDLSFTYVAASDNTETLLTAPDIADLTGAGDETMGGTVEFTSAGTSGDKIMVSWDVEFEQSADFFENQRLNLQSLENAIDTLEIQIQQLKESGDRSLKLPLSESGLTSAAIQKKSERLGHLLGFDAITGNLALFLAVAATIATGAIGSNELGAKAVGLAKLLDGTRGSVLYWGTGNRPFLLGPGSSGQVLKTNGAAADPSWATLAAGSTATRVNVLDYGADPTGVADSSAAFDNARAAAETAKHCNVFAPAGIYNITSVDAGKCTWIGAGARLVTIRCNTANTNMFDDADPGVTFIGLGFDGQKGTMNSGFPIICDTTDVTVRDCYFKDTPYSAALQGNVASTRWKFHYNFCENAGGKSGAAGWPALPFLSGDYNEAIGNIVVCTDGFMGYGVGLEPENGNPRLRHTKIIGNTVIGGQISVDGVNQEANHTVYDTIVQGNYVDATDSYASTSDFESGAPLFIRNAELVNVSNNVLVADPDCHYQGVTHSKMISSAIKDNQFYINPPSGTTYVFKSTVTGSGGKTAKSRIIYNDITNLGTNVPTWLCAATDANTISLVFGGGEGYGNVAGVGNVTVPNDANEDRSTRVKSDREFTDRFSVTPGNITAGTTYSNKQTVGGNLGDMVQVTPLTDIGDGLQVTAQFTDANEVTVYIRNITGGTINVAAGAAVNFRAYVKRFTEIVGGTSTEV